MPRKGGAGVVAMPVKVTPLYKYTEGYIWSYSLRCEEKPKDKSLKPGPYFMFELSSKATTLADRNYFFLTREVTGEEVDEIPLGSISGEAAYLKLPYAYWAVSYGSLSMAIIAAVKDAFEHKRKVRVWHTCQVRPKGAGPFDLPSSPPSKWLKLRREPSPQ